MLRVKWQIKHQFNICYVLSLAELHRKPHPEDEVDGTCIAFIYYHKRLNRLQKFDLTDLVRRLLACIGSTCHGDETCVHCRKLTKVIWKHYTTKIHWLIKMFPGKFSTVYICFIFILYSSN